MSSLATRPTKPVNRRRSQRILLTIAILVEGQTPSGHSFAESTSTSVVNAHGASMLLKQLVHIGHALRITNLKTGETSQATVIDISSGAEGGVEVGVELQKSSPRFWRVAFPPVDWSPHSAEAKRFVGGTTIDPKRQSTR
jgi:hypothetical protein